jgi:hypothetical protein
MHPCKINGKVKINDNGRSEARTGVGKDLWDLKVVLWVPWAL